MTEKVYPTTRSFVASDLTVYNMATTVTQCAAYIVWVYGLMFDADKDFLSDTVVTAYAAKQSDDKVMFCDLSAAKNNDGHGGHPNVAANAAAAEILTAFIEANCADALG